MFSKLNKLSIVTKPQIILLMGGPGSGKDMLATNLTALNHISVGDCLRKIAASNHPQAQFFKSKMQQGQLLPDADISRLLLAQEVMRQNKLVLLDGYPRTFSQWSAYKNLFGLPTAVINLSVSSETMSQRLLRRARSDDNPEAIIYRINDYFSNTRPMALNILAENPNALDLNTDHLTPKEVAEQTIRFLDECGINALEAPPVELQRKSKYFPTLID